MKSIKDEGGMQLEEKYATPTRPRPETKVRHCKHCGEDRECTWKREHLNFDADHLHCRRIAELDAQYEREQFEQEQWYQKQRRLEHAGFTTVQAQLLLSMFKELS